METPSRSNGVASDCPIAHISLIDLTYRKLFFRHGGQIRNVNCLAGQLRPDRS